MAIDTSIPRTRRALLAGGIGGLAAVVASAIGRPLPASAGTDGDVVLGASNTASAMTSIASSASITILRGQYTGMNENAIALAGIGGTGYGVYGESDSVRGVWGASTSGTGVVGECGSGFGVIARSDKAAGLFATSYSTNWSAAAGWSRSDRTGVFGYSGASSIPASPAKTGVYGYAAQDANARGVHGQTTAGYGLNGVATTGQGVHGEATTGYGVRGYATTGTALYAATSGAKVGTALRTVGKVRFDKSVGSATILAGTSSIVVTPGIDLTSTSIVTATLMGSAGGTTTVHRVSVNATADTFTIYLTANSTVNVKVGWHVFG